MRASAFAAGVLTLLVAAVPALALGILGTDRPETIRGTASNDRIFARGGDDRVLGLGGNDVLAGGSGRDRVEGGPGNDRLALVDDTRDRAACGPGLDTVVADDVDAIGSACENVTRVPPPPPPPPPPRTIIPGRYAGKTTQGHDVTFQVSSGGTLSRLVLTVDLTCRPGGSRLAWRYDSRALEVTVARDGTFALDESETEPVGGVDATFRTTVAGRFQSGFASGTVAVEARSDVGGITQVCDVTPRPGWTAAAAILNQP